MDKVDLEILEFWAELNANNMAEELGVEYKVKAKIKENCLDILVRIKSGNKNNGVFAEYIGKLIVDKYGCGVRFTYPSKL